MLIFEKSRTGRGISALPKCDVEVVKPDEAKLRTAKLHLPEMAEVDLSRHYTELAHKAHGVNDGFYPLGSCTMKYNPRVNEIACNLPGFTEIHPLQPEGTVQGCKDVIKETHDYLCEITGMSDFTMQPAAGAHGEFTGLLLIKSYHVANGDTKRTKIIVPDSAHGTNPASAVMAGMTVINVDSTPDGLVDLDKLREVCEGNDEIAGLMLTNPNTAGLFDPNIKEITSIVHEAGGLCYYDGANLNAIMGWARPGDMGFDCVHLNLHKTFSTPHGGGGPGAGPVGCKEFLAKFMPGTGNPESLGEMKTFYGNFLVVVRALTYLKMLGKEGIPEASKNAVLNANYMMHKLSEKYDIAFNPKVCMHEFIMDIGRQAKETGVTAMDIAKGLLDNHIHPPTMYFPLTVHEALMAEPTETESKETLDNAIQVFLNLYDMAYNNPDALHAAPVTTPVTRLDEVGAARNPILKWEGLND